MGFFDKLAINRYSKIADKVIALEDSMKALSDEEKYICEFKESQETPEKQESRVDYALIIVVCVIGVILIIISACICKKFICQKNEVESIEEIEEGFKHDIYFFQDEIYSFINSGDLFDSDN